MRVLFRSFPKSAMCYNLPHLLSDFGSFKYIDEFFKILHEIDSVRLTTLNSRLESIFNIQYVDQVIDLLLNGPPHDQIDYEPPPAKKSRKKPLPPFTFCENVKDCTTLEEVRQFTKEFVDFLKLPKTKRLPSHVSVVLNKTKTLDRYALTTILLVLFKCVEKPGLKTNFFLKFVKSS